MLCQNCGENEANVKYTQIVNGVKKQMILCEKCAQDLGIQNINFNMPIDFSSFLGDMIDEYENLSIGSEFVEPKMLTCDKCNMTYEEFLNTGKFGCDNCYETFKNKINALLKNIHGANTHIGRISGKVNENINENNIKFNKNIQNKEENKNEIKIEKLKEKLKQQIKEEKYEEAAKTRDEIKKIEK